MSLWFVHFISPSVCPSVTQSLCSSMLCGVFLSIFKEICIVLVINQKQCKLLIFVEKLNSVGFVFVIRLKLLTVMTF